MSSGMWARRTFRCGRGAHGTLVLVGISERRASRTGISVQGKLDLVIRLAVVMKGKESEMVPTSLPGMLGKGQDYLRDTASCVAPLPFTEDSSRVGSFHLLHESVSKLVETVLWR